MSTQFSRELRDFCECFCGKQDTISGAVNFADLLALMTNAGLQHLNSGAPGLNNLVPSKERMPGENRELDDFHANVSGEA
jgi:hypothetical protein